MRPAEPAPIHEAGGATGGPIYAHDPHARPDDDYEPGRVHHLRTGNAGRMLDPRRTPVEVVGVQERTGSFALRVCAFEDAGATWTLALEDVGGFQFERGSPRLGAQRVRELVQIGASLDRPLRIAAVPRERVHTLAALRRERARLRPRVRELEPVDVAAATARRIGPTAARAMLREILEERELWALEQALSQTLVSNPASGEVVKGHAIVLAQMGLCPFRGKLVRDPELFGAGASCALRRAHVLARMAFLAELLAHAGRERVVLYRADALARPADSRVRPSLRSATFAREVALAHCEGVDGRPAATMSRGAVASSRLLMTFLETDAMNEPYREAEALVIAPAASPARRAPARASRSRSPSRARLPSPC